MNRLILIMCLLIIQCPFAEARAPRLFYIESPIMPKDTRLMGFELTIYSGRVAALRDCPAGWHVEIDNDAAWHATIKAYATVGAAALDADALRTLVLLAPAPDVVIATAAKAFSVSARATVMRNGDLYPFTLHHLRLAALDGGS